MKQKLFDSELKIMKLIWQNEKPISAKNLSVLADKQYSWNKNTTYTVIKKLVAKGFIRRDEPGFICTALVSQSEMQKSETVSLLNRMFNGSRKALFSSLLEDENLSESEIEELQKYIDHR